MKKFLLILSGMALVFALAACEDDVDEETTSTDTSTDPSANAVTFSGTLSGPAASALVAGLANDFSSVLDPTQYEIFCVTFTNPPFSGSGTFDANGSFSVTVEDAAGLPVGCFIVEAATGVSVATLTFEVGTATDFDDGTTSATALEGGTYTIDITFDPEAGTATADITALAASTVEVASTFDPATLPGTWALTCDAANAAEVLLACQQFLEEDPNTPFSIYLDVIRATIGTEVLHAMGVWADRDIFIAAGSTEGIDAGAIPADVTLESLNSDVTGSTAVGLFAGMTSDLTYNGASSEYPHTMSGDGLLAFLAANNIPYDAGFDNGAENFCTADSLVLTAGEDRSCLLEFYEQLGNQAEDGLLVDPALSVVVLMPRLSGEAWDTFANPLDAMGDPLGADGSTLIQFSSTRIAGTPEIGARFALMDLELSGDTGIARQFESYSFTGYDPVNMTEIQCNASSEITITFVVTDVNSMSGWFIVAESDSCAGVSEHDSFQVTFSRL